MWKRREVDLAKRYWIELCQDEEGRRYFALREVGCVTGDPFAVLRTEEVPQDLLLSGDVMKMSDSVRLEGGASFVTDAHGIWFTVEEAHVLFQGNHDLVPWVTGQPPLLPPK